MKNDGGWVGKVTTGINSMNDKACDLLSITVNTVNGFGGWWRQIILQNIFWSPMLWYFDQER
jgi:hypothetical protein